VLDARTGRPVNHDTVSVTVLEQDPSLADAWSTALLCLGATDGRAVADRHGIAALFIEEVEGKLSEVTTRQWREMSGIEID
jgi:thiamine biosynthesis lipoprotein